MIANPKPDGPEVTQRLIHWMLGTGRIGRTREVWLVVNYMNEYAVATTAVGLFHHLMDDLDVDHEAVGNWLRQPHSEKVQHLLALKMRSDNDDEEDATYDLLLFEWGARALVTWSESPEAKEMFPLPTPLDGPDAS